SAPRSTASTRGGGSPERRGRCRGRPARGCRAGSRRRRLLRGRSGRREFGQSHVGSFVVPYSSAASFPLVDHRWGRRWPSSHCIDLAWSFRLVGKAVTEPYPHPRFPLPLPRVLGRGAMRRLPGGPCGEG